MRNLVPAVLHMLSRTAAGMFRATRSRAFWITGLGVLAALITVSVFLGVLPPIIRGHSNRELSNEELSKMLDTLVVSYSADQKGTSQNLLNDVDITATLPPTVTGDVTYQFDCTDDGTWEMTTISSSRQLTAFDLCDYPSPGSYTLRVRATTEDSTFENTAGFVLSADVSLFVDVSAHPSWGTAPLNGVDLVASVSGTATGDILYMFDCTSDGIWEWQETVSTDNRGDTTIAEDLCDYTDPGDYTASMRAERGGFAFQVSAAIIVLEP
jgi:hypothetical protein